MRYNNECTVWHKKPDGNFVTLHYSCWWQDTEAENISKTGKTDVDTAMVHLPPDATVSKSDYIAKGCIDYVISGSVTELLKTYKPLKVSTVSSKCYGSALMHHTEVTAR
ncbi:MAG: hypothetical protein Q4D35_03060 [Ruminococcus sp.]|nr:hypothetical protein [Ruminococcus sp.]